MAQAGHITAAARRMLRAASLPSESGDSCLTVVAAGADDVTHRPLGRALIPVALREAPVLRSQEHVTAIASISTTQCVVGVMRELESTHTCVA